MKKSKKNRSLPILVAEMVLAFIISKIAGGDFYGVFFNLNMVVIAIMSIVIITLAFSKGSGIKGALFGAIYIILVVGLTLFIPWLISVVVKVNFYKVFFIMAIILELANIVNKGKDK